MSYLTQYAVSHPAAIRPGRRGVRVYVEATSNRRLRQPSPRLKLRIADCMNQINLEFSVDTPELRENSLYKIDTLLAALERFRAGLAAESELRALRERGSSGNPRTPRGGARCLT